jgi:uncharacterized protein
MEHFTPIAATAGGALIGLAAALLWIANGRIAGISGIVGGLMGANAREIGWRVAFLFGLLAAPLGYAVVAGMPAVTVAGNPSLLATAGLLIGFGTRLGSGCTSGHGVCGIAAQLLGLTEP